MATKACTIVNQGWGNVNLNQGYGTGPAYAGLASGTYFVTSLKFTTPTFAGVPASIDFTIVMGLSGYDEKSSRLRYALCTSDANIKSYENTAAAVTDPNQITSGITVVSGGLSAYDTTNTITVDASAIKPNTTYYLVLWAGDKVTGYGQGMGLEGIKASTPSATLTYYDNYKLNISQGTGSIVTVKNSSGQTLSNGATITYGDVLTISFGASTGYNLRTHTVNGYTFTSGGTHTVTGDVSVVATASLKSFILSISAGTGVSVVVTRGGTRLSNGATIYYGDSLVVSFSANTGYYLTATSHSNGSTITVTGNVSVSASAAVLSYDLSISAGTGSGITVKRTSSPLQGAPTGVLSNGAAIYYSDVLIVSFSVSTGYNLGAHTVNGSAFTSGGSHTVTGNVSVASTANLKTFTLSLSAGTGVTVSVKRNGSSLGNGATVTYGDSLVITFAVAAGYCINKHTVNGAAFSSGGTHKVTGNVQVVASADILAYPIGNGSGSDLHYAYIGDGAGGGAYYVAYIGTDDGPTLYGSNT